MATAKIKKNSVVYLSTYPPRECGIATFTSDLAGSIDKQFHAEIKTKIAAINESPTSFYTYSPKVRNIITATNVEDYVELARTINTSHDIKLVHVQHEFGIFEGEWGDYIIPFLQVVQKPVVITLHSVLPNPNDRLSRTMRVIGKAVKAFIVMNDRSREILETQYDIPRSKIQTIPHGAPQTTFETTKTAKIELGLQGRVILSTFGMLSEDKGIQYAIRALPNIVRRHPRLLYLVIGATHPVVRRNDGEVYRNFLLREVEKLGLKDHVKFYDKYLTLEEIIMYLKATDVYIAPNINPQQSVSGTLSYALACGRAVISTPTEYARYVISRTNGAIAEFKNPASIEKALRELLGDDKLLRSMHANAYRNTRHMTWPNVAAAHVRLYKKLADFQSEKKVFPAIKFDHIHRLTDDFGILQHARYSRPEKRFGYSTDDISRALLVCAIHYEAAKQHELLRLMNVYLRFLKFSQRHDGSFSNIVTYQRRRDTTRESDVLGRALWALGCVASRETLPEEIIREADRLFQHSLRGLQFLESPRARAFAMIGLSSYVQCYPKKNVHSALSDMANRQMKLYQQYSSPDWQWFEDELTYSNSKLSESLLYAYSVTGKKKYLDVAEHTLTFLSSITFGKHYYSPIGQAGWYHRDKKRAYFDQQPEDAASMVETKILAYKLTGAKSHLEDAHDAFQWFLGKNHLEQTVYDQGTGGCHDGVGQNMLNMNQGAESTLSYLLARLAIESIHK
jgi:glycosyltransferase involved in cell wall biosynthesis